MKLRYATTPLDECKRRFLKTEFGFPKQQCQGGYIWWGFGRCNGKVGNTYFSKTLFQSPNGGSKLACQTQIFLAKRSYEINETEFSRCHTKLRLDLLPNGP
ncbi:hypothetical protein P167DRAFT_392611 [Morchella conica CCBAS932]|uniref:Uncharacterized protein n=1 Tax=Morchella conica CCBAS932 TaxID=1392247 RepID=A0A3N4KB64_9PEZI|nr:hypothetical protein P167DRAFT_392611 [Morchella conica CCBAS932]